MEDNKNSTAEVSNELDLTEILEGCEGIELYSTVYGNVKLYSIDKSLNHPIILSHGIECSVSKEGKHFYDEPGECTLFPSRENRDWNAFERPVHNADPIGIGTMVMCSTEPYPAFWSLREYTGNGIVKNPLTDARYDYIVPLSGFDFDNIESNLITAYRRDDF